MKVMPRPLPPYLSHEKTRHGKWVWYFRRDGKRIRITAEFGTQAFDDAYDAAKAASRSDAPAKPAAAARGSLAWLIERYRDSLAWSALSAATKRQRENIFVHVVETGGAQPFAKITVATIIAGRERRKDTPAQARNFLDAMRGLFRWATDGGFVRVDPTIGAKNPTRKKGPGFRPWTEDDVTAYEKRWPIGTRQRVWLDVLLYTGLRRGDAVRLGRQHVRDNVATLKTEKSGETITVTLPILPVLRATIKGGPCGDLTYIVGANGAPLTKESFGNVFKEACRDAGVPGSAHGVRKIAATRAANAGATVAQLEAIFGWEGGTMASLYTREADRRRLALEAMSKLGKNKKRRSIVAP